MYKLTESGVQRLSDMAFIPEAEGNTDWQEYKKWLADGGVPESMDTKPLSSCLSELKQEVNAYICSHYDMGTQASFQAMYSIETTPAEIKTLLLSVWAWVQSVLREYYTKRAEISASSVPHLVTWDFSQFDVTDPGVALDSFIV